MAPDHGKQKIRVIAVCPGGVDTSLLRKNAASHRPEDPEGRGSRPAPFVIQNSEMFSGRPCTPGRSAKRQPAIWSSAAVPTEADVT